MGIVICLAALFLFTAPPVKAECPLPSAAPLAPGSITGLVELSAPPKSLALYRHYLDDTLQGLEKMRGPNGLLWDHASVVPGLRATLKPVNAKTTPTNIGLDLLVQAAMADTSGADASLARKNLSKIMETLADPELPVYHGANGSILFFDRYPTTGKHVDEADKNVSSVDNINLAIGLWTVAHTFPHEPFGEKAQVLISKMDFAPFYRSDGLIDGNLKYDSAKHSWAPEVPRGQAQPWVYGDYGSEARSLYLLGDALGLFKGHASDSKFVSRAMSALQTELYPSKYGRILRVWDGGIFQEHLPSLLINEGDYSSAMAESASALGAYALDLGKRQGHVIPGTKGRVFYPAAYSASGDGPTTYNGQFGIKRLAATANPAPCHAKEGAVWESVVTSHAVFLLSSTSSPDAYAPILSAMQKQKQGKNRLYNKGIGFSDGVYPVNTADGLHKRGEVVPDVYSLDKGMEAYSMIRILDQTGRGPSAAALASDPEVRQRLERDYAAVDRKFATVVPTALSCGN